MRLELVCNTVPQEILREGVHRAKTLSENIQLSQNFVCWWKNVCLCMVLRRERKQFLLMLLLVLIYFTNIIDLLSWASKVLCIHSIHIYLYIWGRRGILFLLNYLTDDHHIHHCHCCRGSSKNKSCPWNIIYIIKP